jgi:hypothetical protein
MRVLAEVLTEDTYGIQLRSCQCITRSTPLGSTTTYNSPLSDYFATHILHAIPTPSDAHFFSL